MFACWPILPLLPLLAAALCAWPRRAETVRRLLAGGGLLTALAAATVGAWALRPAAAGATRVAAAGWLLLDALGAWHLLAFAAVFGLASVQAFFYFAPDRSAHPPTPAEARRFGAGWFGAAAAALLALLANHLGLLWVGLETTTLLTAFLICRPVRPAALEAMWKYLIVCSVGVAFAFMGTLLLGAAARPLLGDGAELLQWTRLRAVAGAMDPRLIKPAFVFLLVGYGTKAGLAPLHSWLPDAHSQAPAPVSALFSGFLLNTALFAALRCLPLAAAAGADWAPGLLRGFGLLSVALGAIFVALQHDWKRLLAYSSLEHLGLMALGFGCGPAGRTAALLHLLNHAFAKSLGFFGIGRLGQLFGSHEKAQITGAAAVSPLWSGGTILALLALGGAAPLGLFWSEFLLAQALVARGAWIGLGVTLAALGLVFAILIKGGLELAWGAAPPEHAPGRAPPPSIGERALVALPALALLALGWGLPLRLRDMLAAAARALEACTP